MPFMSQQQICPTNTSYMPHIKNCFCADMSQEECQYIYTSYEFNWIYNVTEALAYIHFTLLECTIKQTCLPHCTCMLHCTATVLYIEISHSSNIIKKCNFYLSHYCYTCATKIYIVCLYICLWTHCGLQCDQEHWYLIHFTLLSYAPEYICLPHCTCMSHSTTTLLFLYVNSKKNVKWLGLQPKIPYMPNGCLNHQISISLLVDTHPTTKKLVLRSNEGIEQMEHSSERGSVQPSACNHPEKC